MIATILWTFIAVVSVAFQCPIPRPWELFSPRCFDQVGQQRDNILAIRLTYALVRLLGRFCCCGYQSGPGMRYTAHLLAARLATGLEPEVPSHGLAGHQGIVSFP